MKTRWGDAAVMANVSATTMLRADMVMPGTAIILVESELMA